MNINIPVKKIKLEEHIKKVETPYDISVKH